MTLLREGFGGSLRASGSARKRGREQKAYVGPTWWLAGAGDNQQQPATASDNQTVRDEPSSCCLGCPLSSRPFLVPSFLFCLGFRCCLYFSA